MTKTAMPEPVACLWVKDGEAVAAFHRPPRLNPNHPFDEYWINKGYSEKPLITTTQAEAYADARVREALAAVESKLDAMQAGALKQRVPEDEDASGWNADCTGRALAFSQAILEIRTLLPKQ